jgi:protein PhnA
MFINLTVNNLDSIVIGVTLMSQLVCPACNSENTYPDRDFWVCIDCAHEWNPNEAASSDEAETVVKDINGIVLTSGDSVVVMKDLKIKGASGSVKSGTKVKNIRLIAPIDGHNIACKIDGIGAINLKSEFVKKA